MNKSATMRRIRNYKNGFLVRRLSKGFQGKQVTHLIQANKRKRTKR